MKSFKNLLTLCVALSAMVFMTSCGEDDVVIDPGTDGINVADGFYIAASGADPIATASLTAEQVEDDGFAAQDRTGFVTGFSYLAAGDYQIVEISDKAVAASFGASAEAIEDMVSGCDKNNYTLVKSEAGDAKFAVATSGLYKVTYDPTTSEVVLLDIRGASLIGSATPGGWGADSELSGSVNAEGGSWSATDVEMRAGEYKLRFNCRWTIDRRIDPAAGFGADNGYQMFTNLGGSAANLVPGGSNIPFALEDEGLYTATVTWTPADGLSFTAEKTGDVAPITFKPDENQWAITGDATPNGWPSTDPPAIDDHDLNYDGVTGGTYSWSITIDLKEGGFKFRANDEWNKVLGYDELKDGADAAGFGVNADGNIIVGAGQDGTYTISLFTADEGANYSVTFVK